MKKILLFALLIASQIIFSQGKGTVKGIVTDSDMDNQPLAFANVFIKGTTIGATTEMDGTYSIAVPEGKQTIVFSFIGYETKTKEITVKAGKVITVNQVMGSSGGQKLENIEIKATVSKERMSATILDQKKANVIKESIGAVELSKKGVSDAAVAATKISGVKQSEGSGDIYIRGLGDRYLSTSLNGLPIPSDDVDNKNINLGLFSTGIIQNVGISKTYSTEGYADQASGNVNVESKEYSGKKYVLSLGGGVNTNVLDLDEFKTTAIRDNVSFGFFDKGKGSLVDKITNQSWNTQKTKFPYNYSASFLASDKFDVLGNSLRFSSSVALSKSSRYKNGHFIRYRSGDFYAKYNDVEEFTQNENITGYLGAAYDLGDFNKLKYTFLFINKGSEVLYEQGRDGKGYARDEEPTEMSFMRDQNFIQTELMVNQLSGKHKLNDSNTLTWAGSYNFLTSEEPNRIANQINKSKEGSAKPFTFAYQQDYQQRKSAQKIQDNDYNFIIKNEWSFGYGDEEYAKPYKLNIGFNYRNKKRNFRNLFVGVKAKGVLLESIDNVDALFTPKNVFYSNSNLDLNIRKTDLYSGKLNYYSGFLNFDFKTNSKVSGNIGVRFEHNDIRVLYDVNNSDAGLENKIYNGVYPSANVKFEINETNFIRFASSITQTLPEFKEIAPFQYNSPSGRIYKGTPKIKKSDVYNVDLKYELYPSRDEVFSVTTFFKKIMNPINLAQQRSAAGDLIFDNTGDKATAIGIELEGKFNLIKNEEDKAILSATGNFSRIWTKQDLFIDYQYKNVKDSKLQGASEYILNGSLSYSNQKENEFTATLTGNYSSDNVFALGNPESAQNRQTDFNHEIIEKGFVTLDLVMSKKINNHFSIKLSAKNLLDPQIKLEQYVEKYDSNLKKRIYDFNAIVESYKRGRQFSLGLSYDF